MELIVFCFLFMVPLSLAAPHHDNEDYYDYSSEEFAPKQPEKVIVKPQTDRPISTYEVTENVDDIPNPNPVRKPIIANFTTRTPLNVVPANNLNNSVISNQASDANNVSPIEQINNPFYFGFDKENPDEEEFDNENDNEETDYDHEEFHNISHLLPSLRAYLYGIRKGLINGFNAIIGRRSYIDVNKNVDDSYRANHDLYVDKHRKNDHVAKNSKYFGHKFGDDY